MGLSNCVNIPLPISHSLPPHSHAAKSKSSTTLSVLYNSQNLDISWIPEKLLLALKRRRPNSAHTCWTPVACIAQILKLVVREQQNSENLSSLSFLLGQPPMITSQFQNYLPKWVQHELVGPKSSDQNEKEMKMVGPTSMSSQVTYFHPRCRWKLKQTYLAYEVLMMVCLISLLPVPKRNLLHEGRVGLITSNFC
jgi:hypothetical protein